MDFKHETEFFQLLDKLKMLIEKVSSLKNILEEKEHKIRIDMSASAKKSSDV